MAKAYVIRDGNKKRGDAYMFCIEGPVELIEFASKRLSDQFPRLPIQEAGETPDTIRQYFSVYPAQQSVFMSIWVQAKADAPKHKSRLTKPGVKGNGAAVEEAQRELEKAEASLQRTIARSKKPGITSIQKRYYVKAISTMNGSVRRAHRQLVMNQQEAKLLDALFLDSERKQPRPMVVDRVPYKDPFGRRVNRAACRKAAEEHWGMCVKAHRLAVQIGPVQPDYARKMIDTFGSLEAYLGHMMVGDVTALRLPVIEKAIAQLKDIPANIEKSTVLSAYRVAIDAVNEFAAWLELVNAMYHRDVLTMVEGITELEAFRRDVYDEAMRVLKAMRKRLTKEVDIPKGDINAPFTISVCAPDDLMCSPEEAA